MFRIPQSVQNQLSGYGVIQNQSMITKEAKKHLKT